MRCGAWELLRDNWQSVGGSFCLMEWQPNVPKSYPLYGHFGETCGSAFWMFLNHRLHLLWPEDERYVSEIEKSIYNVILANQGGSFGIRYYSNLLGRKAPADALNTCCEGRATRLIGSLPGFIYSLAADGIYMNLYERSMI